MNEEKPNKKSALSTSRASKLANAAKHSGQIVKGLVNNLFPSEEPDFVKKRLSICQECPSRDASGKSCAIPLLDVPCCEICGCVLKAKTSVHEAACPIDKWGAEPKNQD